MQQGNRYNSLQGENNQLEKELSDYTHWLDCEHSVLKQTIDQLYHQNCSQQDKDSLDRLNRNIQNQNELLRQ